MIGSGPYVISKVDPGRSLTLARNPNYWGRDLGVNRGFWNFDEIRYDFYRDPNALLEAFKRNLFDVRKETDPARWEQGYDFPALRDGQVIKETLTSDWPKPSFYFVFNTRRSVFADVRVREAIATLFDFEWTNKNIFFGLYRRTAGYFDGSELSAHGRPADARERALLAPFPGAVRPDILDGTWSPPVSDGSGRDRALLRRALGLFKQAGYELRGTELVERKSGRPLTFEIMVTARSDAMDEERMALLFAGQLKRAGITVQLRPVDAVQFEARRIAFDFDMISNRWDQSLSPGNEQAFYWSSEAADSNGSRNYMGVKSPAIDAMIDALLKSQDRADVVAAVRALDRVLMSGFYTVPLFHPPDQWIARWTKVRHPEVTSRSGPIPETWWHEPPMSKTVILGESSGKSATSGVGGRATLDDLFRRAADRRPDALALIDPPNRAALHRLPAARPHLFTSRPRDIGHRRAAAPDRAAFGCDRRPATRQHRRIRADVPGRAARRDDRDAAAAALAAGRHQQCTQPRRRQRLHRERPRRRPRSARRCPAGGGRNLPYPGGLLFRAERARRRRRAQRPVRGRGA